MTTFNVTFTGAAGAVATVTQAAAGAGRRNVCQFFTCAAGVSVAGTPRRIILRDGATGVGTIVWSGFLIPNLAPWFNGSLFLVGTANTAMTLEFEVNGDATEIQSVNLGGIVI